MASCVCLIGLEEHAGGDERLRKELKVVLRADSRSREWVLWVLASAVKDIRIVVGAGNYHFRFDLLSFTRAGAGLSLSQPTVSQHVRRLEQAVGRPLFVRDTHSVTLTADGEAMAGFARSILAAHEQAVAYFTGSGLSGRLRFGVTDDLALTPVPRILRDFRQLYPRIDLELTVSQSGALQRRVPNSRVAAASPSSFTRGRASADRSACRPSTGPGFRTA